MNGAYYDSSYLFKLQSGETGANAVRNHASTMASLCSAVHARAEFASACHRKVREGAATAQHLKAMLAQFQLDCQSGLIRLLPLTDAVFQRVDSFYRAAPLDCPLRGADALHLACAAENGFSEVWSHDRHILAAATGFGLRGLDVITQ